jgi:hypothetical protein
VLCFSWCICGWFRRRLSLGSGFLSMSPQVNSSRWVDLFGVCLFGMWFLASMLFCVLFEWVVIKE